MKGTCRRAFLQGLGGAALALPFLSSGCLSSSRRLGRHSGAITNPKRFIVFFTPNGTLIEQWRPTGSETSFQLSPVLAPLQRHQQDLLILDGLNMESANHGPGEAHMMGMGGMLTGIELLNGSFTDGSGTPAGFAGGISIDQAIANAIGAQSRFKSLELGVQVDPAGDNWSRMCYAGANQPLPPENSPYQTFSRVFQNLMPVSGAAQAQRVARQKSILDGVIAQYGSLAMRLDASDRNKLETHLQSVRDLEQRLDATQTSSSSCTAPNLGTPIDFMNNNDYPLIGQLQMDLLVMAMACDLTRVGSIQWTNSRSSTVFSWLGQSDSHHGLSHASDGDTAATDSLTKINAWYATQLAYLIDKLKAIPEGTGTMFDNTVILWSNELGRGNSHSLNPTSLLLAGSAGGAFRTGRYLQYAGRNHNDLLITLGNAFGLTSTTFGNPVYCSGPLTNLA